MAKTSTIIINGAAFGKAKPARVRNDKELRKGAKEKSAFENFLRPSPKITPDDLYAFTHQISILLESGVPLILCLEILTGQTSNKTFKAIIKHVSDEVRGGKSFAEALINYPKVFSNLFISMVKAGEKSGQMITILKQLSSYMDEQNKLQKKLKSIMVYPKFIGGFFGIVLAGIVFGLVPKFQEVFESFGAELPGVTQVLMDISDFLTANIIYEIILISASLILFKKYKQTQSGRELIDRLLLNLPLLGEIISKSIISRFCKTLSVLVSSGVTLVDAIELAADTTENTQFVSALQKVRTGIISGDTLHNKLVQFSIFPPMVTNMVNTGEQSGTLNVMLESIALLYDTHVDTKIAGLTTIIEPALMIGMGVIALIVIIALYLPIFQMSGVIQ